MTPADKAALEQRLGHEFRDAELLALALRHASIAESRQKSNERLEFLGDAVLGLVACQRIYEKFPDLLEGEMTKIKSMVVSRQTCAQIGTDLGLQDLLSLGKGMKSPDAPLPPSLAAAALEAVVAALYIDGGLEVARRFLLPLLDERIVRAASSGHQENFKSILQHHAQQAYGATPVYSVLEEKGPDHAKHFHVQVRIQDRVFEPAWGASKKQAEQAAALEALRTLELMVLDEAGQAHLAKARKSSKPSETETAEKSSEPAREDATPSR